MSVESALPSFFSQIKLRLLETCAPPLAAFLLYLLYKTYRWELHGHEKLTDRCFLLSLWHGHQLVMVKGYAKLEQVFPCKVVALISSHRDGRLAAKLVDYFCIESVAGSSSQGGMKALLKLIREAKGGKNIAITVDGPRGPKEEVKGGIISLAKHTNTAVLPFVAAASSAWRFRSWDGLFLPKPFARVAVVCGKAVEIPRELTIEEGMRMLQHSMRDACEQASRIVKRAQVTEH